MTIEGKVEVHFAYCCAEGGGRVSGCMCLKPDHGTAFVHAGAADSFGRVEPEPGSADWLKRSPNYHPGDLA